MDSFFGVEEQLDKKVQTNEKIEKIDLTANMDYFKSEKEKSNDNGQRNVSYKSLKKYAKAKLSALDGLGIKTFIEQSKLRAYDEMKHTMIDAVSNTAQHQISLIAKKNMYSLAEADSSRFDRNGDLLRQRTQADEARFVADTTVSDLDHMNLEDLADWALLDAKMNGDSQNTFTPIAEALKELQKVRKDIAFNKANRNYRNAMIEMGIVKVQDAVKDYRDTHKSFAVFSKGKKRNHLCSILEGTAFSELIHRMYYENASERKNVLEGVEEWKKEKAAGIDQSEEAKEKYIANKFNKIKHKITYRSMLLNNVLNAKYVVEEFAELNEEEYGDDTYKETSQAIFGYDVFDAAKSETYMNAAVEQLKKLVDSENDKDFEELLVKTRYIKILYEYHMADLAYFKKYPEYNMAKEYLEKVRPIIKAKFNVDIYEEDNLAEYDEIYNNIETSEWRREDRSLLKEFSKDVVEQGYMDDTQGYANPTMLAFELRYYGGLTWRNYKTFREDAELKKLSDEELKKERKQVIKSMIEDFLKAQDLLNHLNDPVWLYENFEDLRKKCVFMKAQDDAEFIKDPLNLDILDEIYAENPELKLKYEKNEHFFTNILSLATLVLKAEGYDWDKGRYLSEKERNQIKSQVMQQAKILKDILKRKKWKKK